jgi:O-acetyl-ADP-ribose deacetylase (regulator of RNase III)
MKLLVRHGDLFDSDASALVLTIDGAAAGMEGNTARQFARRWPDDWEEIAGDVDYPIPLGRVSDHEPSYDCPFELVILASTLEHRRTLSPQQKKSVVATAIEETVRLAARQGVPSVAIGVMSGGWRLTADQALVAMVEGLERSGPAAATVELHVHAKNPGDHEMLASLAEGLGFR